MYPRNFLLNLKASIVKQAPPRTSVPALACVACLMLGNFATSALAHPFTITDTIAILKSDGTFQVDMRIDVDALALGVSSALPSEELAEELRSMPVDEFIRSVERARRTIERRVRVRFDDEIADASVDFPEMSAAERPPGEEPTVLGTTVRFTGRIPPNARTFTFFASRALSAVHLTIFDQPATSATKMILAPGEESPPYALGVGAAPPTRLDVLGQYVVLGFEHILPKGLDHILFVLGLFLLSAKLRPLFWQITAFTVAHSVTLALSTYGMLSLPSRLVETMIAMSIAYVAIENVLTTKLKPWRPAVVFMFGLLHGLGFAGVLRELGLPRGEFLTALISFNVGVELGQIAVVLAALVAVGWLRDWKYYRRVVIIPGSLMIAAVGLYWSVTRALG